jgi:transcriptional regulator with XRE-family HTH domain
MSLEVAAGLAKISPSYLARLERGERQFDRRGLLEKIALALGCSVIDLTGPDPDTTHPEQQPRQSVAKPNPTATALISQLTIALADCTLDDVPDVPARPVPELVAATQLANERGMESGRYDLAGQELGPLLTELHVAAATAKDGTERQAALAALVEASMVAEIVAETLGHPTLAVYAAERGQQAAERHGDPAMIGFAGVTHAWALMQVGGLRRGDHGLTKVIDSLAGVDPTGTDTLAAEAYGLAHLRRAFLAARSGKANTAHDHLGEAARIAIHTGERNGLQLHFGPSNVTIYRLIVGVELQEAGKAYERACTSTIDPAVLGANRTMAGHFYLAQALAQEGGRRDADAIRHLDLADRHDSQRIRHRPVALELLADLNKRAPRKSWLLKSLLNRFGLSTRTRS